MSPEATALFLSIALVAFVVAAVLSHPFGAAGKAVAAAFFVAVGLAAWVVVPWWDAIKAL